MIRMQQSIFLVSLVTSACQPSDRTENQNKQFRHQTSCIDTQQETVKKWGFVESDSIEALLNFIFADQKKASLNICSK